ncbi:MAG: S8 family serine peptidase [Planctomycetota bacterium]|jgi:hypothetical protein
MKKTILIVFVAVLPFAALLGQSEITSNTSGFIPNDEYFPYQWHLHNTGQSGGTPDADINAPEAWEITAGDPNIVIAILDLGVDLDHPDLVNNLVPGYDFYQNDDLPDPGAGSSIDAHGTNGAGLVAAEGNNNIGVLGVAWKCKIMPIRKGSASGFSEADAASAIRWAAEHGADIISCSWGLIDAPAIHLAVQDVTTIGGIGRAGKGCVVFFAVNIQNTRIDPLDTSAYPEVIAVGATDEDDARRPENNFGVELDVVAPSGQPYFQGSIWTTDIVGAAGLNNRDPGILDYTDKHGGTSASAPIAAGVAALILSVEPNLTNEEVRHFLCRSAKDLGDPGRDDYYGWGRVDARAALDMVLAKRCDLNNNWKVDFEDLLILIELWGTDELSVDIAPATKRDGIVDKQDLELMMQYWQIEIPELGLIAHWKLDEIEDDIAYESIQGKDGSLHGEPFWQPSGGKIDGGLQLDGIDDYISTHFVLNPADGVFSVFAWIKDGAPGQVVISQEVGADWLMMDTEGDLMTDIKAPGRTGKPLQSQTNITDGNWHRIAFVWDGSDRILYVDGIEVAKDSQNNLTASNGGLYIGCGKNMEAGTYWSGLIDDIRIYDMALSTEEVANLAQ